MTGYFLKKTIKQAVHHTSGRHFLSHQTIDLEAAQRQFSDFFGIFCSYGCRPEGCREMCVPVKAGDHMPVQVRHHVAQRGQVNFCRLQLRTQHALDAHHCVHAGQAISGCEVRELCNMRRPHHAVESRKPGFAGLNDAQLVVAEHQHAAIGSAQGARSCCCNCRHQIKPAPAQCRRGWPLPRSLATNQRPKSGWPFQRRCSPPLANRFSGRLGSGSNPSGSWGKRSGF